ncbi:translocation protein TolB [Desulfovibrio mangrovi]|nr:translocation protein TolB [Desulfovibrio mangrovi]UZP69184.1 translocation protein TolB [Desulfovibrio mangrovi]
MLQAHARSLEVDIYGPGQAALNLTTTEPLGTAGAAGPIIPAPPMGGELKSLIDRNLYFLPFINIVEGSAILGGNKPAGYKTPDVDMRRYQLAGVDLIVTAGWPTPVPGKAPSVELRVYEVLSGKLVLGKAYYDITPEILPRVADRFCADFMKALTGRGDFFLSTLAFVKKAGKRQKDIWSVHPTGRDMRQLTKLPGLSLSPSWSPDGRYIIFSHISDRYHSLGVWDRLTRRVQHIKFPGNTIIGPTFLPNNKVAVSLASGGNPDIYLLNHVFKKESTLVENWAIDVSPSFDATGTKMAYVSSRRGNPHIFLKNLKTGSDERVTREGNYNTSPSISPDGELVAFSRMINGGHRIFVMDLVTGREKQVTFGPGTDEMPSFAPDGYFLAFSSTRSGQNKIYLTTRHGGEPRQVPTGDGEASMPTWGFVPE